MEIISLKLVEKLLTLTKLIGRPRNNGLIYDEVV